MGETKRSHGIPEVSPVVTLLQPLADRSASSNSRTAPYWRRQSDSLFEMVDGLLLLFRSLQADEDASQVGVAEH